VEIRGFEGLKKGEFGIDGGEALPFGAVVVEFIERIWSEGHFVHSTIDLKSRVVNAMLFHFHGDGDEMKMKEMRA